MGAEDKGLITDVIRNLGEVPAHHPRQYSVTFAAEDSIKFGRAVMRGTDPSQGLLYDGASGEFVGVSRWSKDARLNDGTDNQKIIGYKANDDMALVQDGLINVYVEEAVAVGDPVRIRHTVDTGKFVGDFATTADAGKTTLLGGAEYITATSDAGIATIELSGKQAATTTDDT